MAYVLSCLRHLKQKYSASPGIMMVGHSMGGVVARAAAIEATQDPSLGGCTVLLCIPNCNIHPYALHRASSCAFFYMFPRLFPHQVLAWYPSS